MHPPADDVMVVAGDGFTKGRWTVGRREVAVALLRGSRSGEWAGAKRLVDGVEIVCEVESLD